jgi:hypothetical protein
MPTLHAARQRMQMGYCPHLVCGFSFSISIRLLNCSIDRYAEDESMSDLAHLMHLEEESDQMRRAKSVAEPL